MIVALSVIVGSLFLWELLTGVLMVGWGVLGVLRLLFVGDR